MTHATAVTTRPIWVDLASDDPSKAAAFYSGLFGWDVTVSEDPQYGGYAMAKLAGGDVAGIGPKQMPGMPSVWSAYIGSSDAEQDAAKVVAAGGTVIAPPFDVGDQGRMAVFQDPAGAYISIWQPIAMSGFTAGKQGRFRWLELNARGMDKAVPFYESVFGWQAHTRSFEGTPDYTEFHLDGEQVAGGLEMQPMVPVEVPSYWTVYFGADDVDGSFARATELGAQPMVPPMDFPGGRLAIVSDPEGAMFGLLRIDPREG